MTQGYGEENLEVATDGASRENRYGAAHHAADCPGRQRQQSLTKPQRAGGTPE
jgi:hypothetical protein